MRVYNKTKSIPAKGNPGWYLKLQVPNIERPFWFVNLARRGIEIIANHAIECNIIGNFGITLNWVLSVNRIYMQNTILYDTSPVPAKILNNELI